MQQQEDHLNDLFSNAKHHSLRNVSRKARLTVEQKYGMDAEALRLWWSTRRLQKKREAKDLDVESASREGVLGETNRRLSARARRPTNRLLHADTSHPASSHRAPSHAETKPISSDASSSSSSSPADASAPPPPPLPSIPHHNSLGLQSNVTMDMHQSESPHPISIFPTTQGADDLVAVDQEERLPSHTDAEAAPDAYEERRAFVNEIEDISFFSAYRLNIGSWTRILHLDKPELDFYYSHSRQCFVFWTCHLKRLHRLSLPLASIESIEFYHKLDTNTARLLLTLLPPSVLSRPSLFSFDVSSSNANNISTRMTFEAADPDICLLGEWYTTNRDWTEAYQASTTSIWTIDISSADEGMEVLEVIGETKIADVGVGTEHGGGLPFSKRLFYHQHCKKIGGDEGSKQHLKIGVHSEDDSMFDSATANDDGDENEFASISTEDQYFNDVGQQSTIITRPRALSPSRSTSTEPPAFAFESGHHDYYHRTPSPSPLSSLSTPVQRDPLLQLLSSPPLYPSTSYVDSRGQSSFSSPFDWTAVGYDSHLSQSPSRQ